MSTKARKQTHHGENEPKSKVSATDVKRICQYFAKTGACKFGDKCRFSHNVSKHSTHRPAVSSGTPSSAKRDKNNTGSAANFVPICKFFEKTGECKYGQNCRFSHRSRVSSNSKPHQSVSFSTSTPQASTDVTEFIQRIKSIAQRPNASLKLDNEYNLELWKRSWSAAGVGAELSSASALLTMLMRLPASSLFLPPISDVVRTLARVGQQDSAKTASEKTLLKSFELIADVYEHRLLGQETTILASLRTTCIDKTAELRSNIHTGLIKAIGNPYTAQRASKLLIRSLTVFDRFISDLRRCEERKEVENVPNDEHDSWMGWQNATVGWLQRASWLNTSQLHKEYESVEHYAETLRALMTALTFFWGAGALLPKCRVRKEGANACDQPLHVQVRSARSQLCGQKLPDRQTCTQKATWRCVRHGHDRICDQCLRKTQEALVGEPGPRASTDIYDAVVERETTRRDGLVYIASKLESRKPPAISPNWKTTYRLNCSALVGVVRLGASCEPLSSDSRVEWAEVVPLSTQTGPMNDFSERARGRIALRLLTRADLSTLGGAMEALRPGSRIAIIDTQVFVPEVISVLSALADHGLVDHLHQIQFWPQLIGTSRAGELRNPGADVSDVIRYALDNTQIDVINRLEAPAKQTLCIQITKLALQTKLSGTQLEAFAAALSSSLHCTQGPPGTGKSYLGVVLIRALDLIRKFAIHSGIAVGPIVVLSYKNHALDEILGDLVDTRQWSGAIIRCGKTEDHRIESFMERKSVQERKAQDVLTERVAVMRRTRRFMREIRSLSSAFTDETGVSLHSWKSSWKGSEEDQTETATRWVLQMLRFVFYKKHLSGDIDPETAYKLLQRTMISESDVGEPNAHDRDLLAILQGLQKDTEHWYRGQTNQTYFLLSKWLSGLNPPPRCAAEGCFFASERAGGFCKECHRCILPNCNKRRVDGVLLCEGHRCRYGGLECKKPRMVEADVCSDHACLYCRKHRLVRVLPRIGVACENHTCRDIDCLEAFLSPTLPYCVNHCCLLCHHYHTDNPESVKSVKRIEFSQFCEEHKCSVQACINNRDLRNGLQNYCARHGCIACDGIRQVVDAAMPESRLCTKHRCSSTMYGRFCGLKRETNSEFCLAHTCRFCREEGLPLDKPVIDSKPRNACSYHRLCQHLSISGNTCNERIWSSSAKYCEKHLIRNKSIDDNQGVAGIQMQCEGITTKRKRCKATGKSLRPPYYCAQHQNQKPNSDSESEIEDDHPDSVSNEDSEEIWSHANLLDRSSGNFVSDFELPFSYSLAPEPLVLGQAGVEAAPVKSFTQAKLIQQGDEGEAEGHGLENFGGVQEDVTVVSSQPTSVDADAKTRGIAEVAKVPIVEEMGLRQRAAEGSPLSDHADDIAENRDAFCNPQDEAYVSQTDSDSELELPDQLRHLRDIVDIDSDSGSDSSIEEGPLPSLPNNFKDKTTSTASEDWDWELLLPARWRYVSSFLGAVLADITELAETADTHVEASRRELSEAAAYSFKNARVIGATVVGATRRLHALRASEPFAMIVEEACEVMEPTLVSVLSVRSLRKLELIGDHRQLPAYVQPCWYSAQIANPSIKVSLFERLVLNDPPSCTVLDVQRRMKPLICDLTRCEYEDVVQIEDFDGTKTQLIADKLRDSEFLRERSKWQKEERDLWMGKGNVVPGVKPQVFFWDLQTKEGRASVGLSRCNYGEAKACVALTRWLVYCGVHPGSITIITPYKGQKLTITQELRGVPDESVRRVFVSTVDRYQGDENDIVIFSLVSTRAGNQFVALRNRFIVSLSRARIGLYIIGSSEAVSRDSKGGEGPSHWCRLLRCLRDSGYSQSGLETGVGDSLNGIGPQLSICCPRHTEVTRCIAGAQEFPTGADAFRSFCRELCNSLCHGAVTLVGFHVIH
eukprot:TRINITY_DN15_c0_g1_i2.p1 TRINITY_DN15_c0_g1~~TRINITY_DN15_c0_g1_i2.p1  ORF type:complete len:1900 (+),score=156.23 TRINITY_DN15_c0_g1_i2:342-6041(+)